MITNLPHNIYTQKIIINIYNSSSVLNIEGKNNETNSKSSLYQLQSRFMDITGPHPTLISDYMLFKLKVNNQKNKAGYAECAVYPKGEMSECKKLDCGFCSQFVNLAGLLCCCTTVGFSYLLGYIILLLCEISTQSLDLAHSSNVKMMCTFRF